MKISRRNILKFAVGSAAGIMLTPVPWKVLDDSAIWTQNWPWIPAPKKGESTTRFTTCALCPAACGLRARCVGGQPVGLAGVVDHPLSAGILCPVGLGAHHLAYHPTRIISPVRRIQKFGNAETSSITLDQATEIIANAIRSTSGGECVAVLDQQPGREVSKMYRRVFAQIPHGAYFSAPRVEDATLTTCASMMGGVEEPLGFDFENARTIVSFGAPLFDGWGTPGRMMRLSENRRKAGRPTIYQIETRQSRTALQAKKWIPVKPGTDGVLALGLANVLIQERLCDVNRLRTMAADFSKNDSTSFTETVGRFTPEAVSAITGVSADQIRTLARSMAAEGPTIVLGAGDPAGGPLRPEENIAIASLNFLLGSVGHEGGIVARRRPAETDGKKQAVLPIRQLQEIPDRSIRVLLIDGAESGHALPWSLVERKLADEKALVVSFSPYLAGQSRHAEIIIPSPAFMESLRDVPTPFHSPVETLSLSAPFMTPPPDVVEPADVIKKIASSLNLTLDGQDSSTSDSLKARVQAIYASGKGTVFTPSGKKTAGLKELDTADKLWSALMEGAVWMDEPVSPVAPSRFSFFGKTGVTAQQINSLADGPRANADPSLSVMPYGWRNASGSGQVTPLLSKVYQESGLRGISNQALINPLTAKAKGIADEDAATIETTSGSLQVVVRHDASVMPDVLFVAVGPDGAAINSGSTGDASQVLSLCLAADGRSWRVAPAKISKRTV
jgi:menaquinone reductase, molybdopterin-binding-like subunit